MFKNNSKYRIPSEFRKAPLHKRLPGMMKDGFAGLFNRGSGRSDSQMRPSGRSQVGAFLRELVQSPVQRSKSQAVPSEFKRLPWYKRIPDTLRELKTRPFKHNPSAIPTELRRPFPVRAMAGTLSLGVGLGLGLLGVYRLNVARKAAAVQVAVVAGIPITKSQINHWMEMQSGSDALRQMVDDELTLQFARERRLLPDNEDVDERVRSVRANTAFAEQIEARGLTPSEVAHDCRVQLIREKIFGKGAEVTEQEMLAYYATQCDPADPAAKFYSPAVAHVSEIATISEEEARKAEADLQRGRPFSEVAQEYSKDRNAKAGGEAPAVIRGRSVLSKVAPDFEKAIFQLKPGEWTHPFRIANGNLWLLAKCNSIVPANTQPYAQVREECRRQTAALKSRGKGPTPLALEYLDFRRKSLVQIFWEQYYYDLSGEHKKKPVKSR